MSLDEKFSIILIIDQIQESYDHVKIKNQNALLNLILDNHLWALQNFKVPKFILIKSSHQKFVQHYLTEKKIEHVKVLNVEELYPPGQNSNDKIRCLIPLLCSFLLETEFYVVIYSSNFFLKLLTYDDLFLITHFPTFFDSRKAEDSRNLTIKGFFPLELNKTYKSCNIKGKKFWNANPHNIDGPFLNTYIPFVYHNPTVQNILRVKGIQALYRAILSGTNEKCIYYGYLLRYKLYHQYHFDKHSDDRWDIVTINDLDNYFKIKSPFTNQVLSINWNLNFFDTDNFDLSDNQFRDGNLAVKDQELSRYYDLSLQHQMIVNLLPNPWYPSFLETFKVYYLLLDLNQKSVIKQVSNQNYPHKQILNSDLTTISDKEISFCFYFSDNCWYHSAYTRSFISQIISSNIDQKTGQICDLNKLNQNWFLSQYQIYLPKYNQYCLFTKNHPMIYDLNNINFTHVRIIKKSNPLVNDQFGNLNSRFKDHIKDQICYYGDGYFKSLPEIYSLLMTRVINSHDQNFRNNFISSCSNLKKIWRKNYRRYRSLLNETLKSNLDLDFNSSQGFFNHADQKTAIIILIFSVMIIILLIWILYYFYQKRN